jgi:hypothetical protein
MDITQDKAQKLVKELQNRDIAAEEFCDRGPYCAHVFLTDDRTEYAPALFIFVEDSDSYRIKSRVGDDGWKWTASIQDGEDGDLSDVSLEFIERTFVGDTEANVADQVQSFLRISKYAL